MQVNDLAFIMATIPSPTPTSSTAPVLAPPGAGIPAIERLVGGTIFAIRRRFGSKAAFSTQFARERDLIRSLYSPLADNRLTQRILIPRLRGLEDSSRYWSVAMTLDHLRIVNTHIAFTIITLLRGVAPKGVVSTADVKPNPDITPDVAGSVITEYESSCDRLASVVTTDRSLHTPLRHAHPWFGPLDAHGWHAMSAMHMGIHRAQIARILLELDQSSSQR